MNILTVLGSPRKKGNTNQVMTRTEEKLTESNHRVERINLVDYNVNMCKGCHTCKKSTERPNCPQKDDTVALFDRMSAADAVIYGSPIYFWAPTAQLKAFIDRHCSLVTGFGTDEWQSLMDGKRLGLIMTCEDQIEENADLSMIMFERLAMYLKCSYAGSLVIPFTTKPWEMGDDIKAQAADYADAIVRAQ